VEPLLTTRNEKGEIEGVKYPQITTVLVNAVNEQQANIEAIAKRNDQLENRVRELSAQNQKLRAEMDALLKTVCSMNSAAEICKEER